jgi:hypothetical protein
MVALACLGGCSIYDASLLQAGEPGGDPSAVGGNNAGNGGVIAGGAGGSQERSETPDADEDTDSVDATFEAPPPPPSCMDTVKNGTETDLDCGGMECAPCSTGKTCTGWHDCASGICSSGHCAIAKTCNEIHTASPDTPSSIYQVDVDGAGGADPFVVFCDMKTANGGWTRVGFEPSGSGGNAIAGRLSYLGVEVPTPTAVANASGAALIGPRFNGLYKELWINWGTTFARMTVARDIFVNSVDTAMTVTNFVTSDAKIFAWVNSSGGAIFCRAAKSVDQRPGDTSWAIKPLNDVDTACGCSGMGWTNRGGFYGGVVPATTCSNWGGGWVGAKDNGEKKGGLSSNVDLTLWVR